MPEPLRLTFRSPDETADFARRLGEVLHPGDTILLEGPIGAGKTHLCRALIQSLSDGPVEVPSPTFTLIQTYQTRKFETWHADLYRLGDPGEIAELGLDDAFETHVCLVEWPDRLGNDTPQRALHITLAADASDGDTRHLTLDWAGGDWDARLGAFANA